MTTTPPAADVTALFSDLATSFGFSRAAGACLGTIWRAAQAPSAEDLCTALGLSRSNVSVALKELRQAGLVQVARAPGTRRDFFVADPDPWALLRAALADRHRRELAPLTARLASLAAVAEPDPRIAALATMSAAAEDWMLRALRPDSADFAQMLAADRAEKKKKKHAREK